MKTVVFVSCPRKSLKTRAFNLHASCYWGADFQAVSRAISAVKELETALHKAKHLYSDENENLLMRVRRIFELAKYLLLGTNSI